MGILKQRDRGLQGKVTVYVYGTGSESNYSGYVYSKYGSKCQPGKSNYAVPSKLFFDVTLTSFGS